MSRYRLPPWLRSTSPAPTVIGLLICATGFLLIVLAWGDAAGEKVVYRQLPYVMSAGVTGLGLVMIGVVIVKLVADRRDQLAWERLMDQLIATMGPSNDHALEQR